MKKVIVLTLVLSGVLAGTALADVVHGRTSLSAGSARVLLFKGGARVLVSGRLRSGVALCRTHRVVRLFKKRHGSSYFVARTTTGVGGAYRFAVTVKGGEKLYVAYAGFTHTSYAFDHSCSGSHSRLLTVPKHKR